MANSDKKAIIYRGQEMTRMETFVAAAFAFCLSMLAISVDSVPSNFEEFFLAAKSIPGFAASFAIIVWIWYDHSQWCRRYGLEDGAAALLSCVLVFLVLIYVYPLRMMMQGLFGFLSNGYFPFPMQFDQIWEVRFMFAFYASGFLALCITFYFLYRHTLNLEQELALTEDEIKELRDRRNSWFGVGCVCVLSLAIALLVPVKYISLSGFVYFLNFLVFYFAHRAQK